MKNKRKKRKFLYFVDGSDGLAYIKERAPIAEYLEYVFAGLDPQGNPIQESKSENREAVENTDDTSNTADTKNKVAPVTLFYMLGMGALSEYKSDILPQLGQCESFNFKNGISCYRRYLNSKYYIDNGIDIMDEVVKESHRRNIDVFFDFRMNDIHDHWDNCYDFMPVFKLEHPEWLNPREIFPDYSGKNEMTTSLNYLKSQVRDFKLSAIREIIEKYDFDGLNLDFMRSQFYFRWDKGFSLLYVFTDFVRQVRNILDEAVKKRGKNIELSVRICPTIEGSRYAGFDIDTWAREGLTDIVTAGTGGLNIGTRGYKAVLDQYDTGFYPCLYGDYEKISSSVETLRGIAENLLSDSPDGIYAFNTYPVERNRYDFVRELVSGRTFKGRDKTYISDVNYDYNLCHEEWRYGINLPVEMTETKYEFARVPLRISDDTFTDPGATVRLKVFIKDYTNDDEFIFRFNGHILGEPVLKPVEGEYLQQWLCWDVKAFAICAENQFEVRLVKRNPYLEKYVPCSIERVNIEIKFSKESK